jgi:hypothetical protein
MKIDWYGPETKPVNRAAFATKGRKVDLEKWQGGDRRFRHVAVISEAEVTSLEKLLSKKPFSINVGHYNPKQAKQQYVITINSRGKDYYMELAFSKRILKHLELIRGCLEQSSRAPIDKLIAQSRSWKT